MFFYSSRVVSRGPGFDLPPKKISLKSRGFFSAIAGIFLRDRREFSPRSPGIFSAIAGNFLRDRGEFSPRSRRFFSAISGIFLRDHGDFSPRFLPRKVENDSPFWRAGFDETDANRYSGPPRRPDEVLDPMRPPPPCRMQRSFERHMDTTRKIRSVPWRWTGSNSLPESHDPCDSEIAGAV